MHIKFDMKKYKEQKGKKEKHGSKDWMEKHERE